MAERDPHQCLAPDMFGGLVNVVVGVESLDAARSRKSVEVLLKAGFHGRIAIPRNFSPHDLFRNVSNLQGFNLHLCLQLPVVTTTTTSLRPFHQEPLSVTPRNDAAIRGIEGLSVELGRVRHGILTMSFRSASPESLTSRALLYTSMS